MCFNLFYSNLLLGHPLQFAVGWRTVNPILGLISSVS